MHKKEYVIPELAMVRFTLRDTICSSPEDFGGYVDPNPGGTDDPIIDPDDDITW